MMKHFKNDGGKTRESVNWPPLIALTSFLLDFNHVAICVLISIRHLVCTNRSMLYSETSVPPIAAGLAVS